VYDKVAASRGGVKMKKAAAGLGILLVILGAAGVAHAQNWIQVQGRIQAIDCQATRSC
jgi:hypothetical protein